MASSNTNVQRVVMPGLRVAASKALEALRSMIERAHKREPEFRKAAEEFLKHAQEAINPSLTEADVREMLIH